MNKFSFLISLLVAIVFMSCYYDNKEDLYQYVVDEVCTETTATYTAQIVPILQTHCYQCHRNERQDGGVNVEGYTAVKPYVDNGSLYGTSNHESGFSVMPTSGVKIPFCDLEQIRIWIEAGALNN